MATLSRKNGTYHARFRFNGKQYRRSLKTADRIDAEAALLEIKRVIHRLMIGMLSVPDAVEAGDYIVSGGTLMPPATRPAERVVPALESAVSEYLANLEHLAESNRYTIGVHLRNLKKKLCAKVNGPIDQVEKKDLEAFIQTRLKERARSTVSKERQTIADFCAWCVDSGYLLASPAVELTRVTASAEKDAFQTLAEIQAIQARGGLTQEESWALWDLLYLTPSEIADVLALVRERSKAGISFILHAICAYSGMRRGEVLRLRWTDVKFDQGILIARSKKQSRQTEETQRTIDLHPELKAILIDWQTQRPLGQYVVCEKDSLDPLTPRKANRYFWRPLRRTSWCLNSHRNLFKLGFHTYRHSFASNLAAAGVDERVVDEFLGHCTLAMRKRYRHLFPQNRRSAIQSFSLQANPGDSASSS